MLCSWSLINSSKVSLSGLCSCVDSITYIAYITYITYGRIHRMFCDHFKSILIVEFHASVLWSLLYPFYLHSWAFLLLRYDHLFTAFWIQDLVVMFRGHWFTLLVLWDFRLGFHGYKLTPRSFKKYPCWFSMAVDSLHYRSRFFYVGSTYFHSGF